MKFKHVHFVINPATGKNEPILSYINAAMCDTDMAWDISVVTRNKSLEKTIKEIAANTDLIVIYGGDGTVCCAAGILHTTSTPMAIVPGGTANVVAKELGIPIDSVAALELLKSNWRLKKVDIGMVNDTPFLLRVNLGILAEMIAETSNELKNYVGQLAYGLTAVRNMFTTQPVKYKMIADGVHIEEESVALTVTNCGSNGIGSGSLQPGISPTDGLLDILSLQTADITSLMKIAGSSLFSTETDAIKHWTCKDVIITADKPMHYLCDDTAKTATELQIRIIPAKLNILIPANSE